MQKPSIRFSFKIYDKDKPFLGTGRIELMQLINKFGSISKASKAMGMSYRKAWQMVKDLNEMSKKPMIEIRLGGKSGGGAVVTPDGLNAMEKYFVVKKKAELFFDKVLSEVDF